MIAQFATSFGDAAGRGGVSLQWGSNCIIMAVTLFIRSASCGDETSGPRSCAAAYTKVCEE